MFIALFSLSLISLISGGVLTYKGELIPGISLLVIGGILLIIVFVRSARKGYLSSMDCVPEICENIPDICDGDCNPLS